MRTRALVDALERGEAEGPFLHLGVEERGVDVRDGDAALRERDDAQRAHELVRAEESLTVDVGQLPRARERILRQARELEECDRVLPSHAAVVVGVRQREPSPVQRVILRRHRGGVFGRPRAREMRVRLRERELAGGGGAGPSCPFARKTCAA